MMLQNLALASTTLLAVSISNAALIDFETAGDYTANFRNINTNLSGNPTQTSNGAANDYVGIIGGTAAIAAYDTTPASGAVKSTFTVAPGQPFTFSVDVAFKTAKSSFGVYLIDPSNENSATAYLALFNVDNGSGATLDKELIRFSSDANPTISSNAGTIEAAAPYSASSVMAANTTLSFTPLTLTYSLSGTDGILAMTVGSYTRSYTIANGRSTFEVGLRLAAQNTGTNVVAFDNFSAVVPEPASMSALLLGAGALVARRRHTA